MSTTLEYIFNHVFLPIQLPQADDGDAKKDLQLCSMLLQSLETFTAMSDCVNWHVVVRMIARLSTLNNQLDRASKIRAVRSMLDAVKDQDFLAIPIREQNACVLIRACGGETVFEAFEVDPPNEVIMGATGRIIRSFPDASITVPNRSISNEFKDELASFLVKMDGDVLDNSIAHTKKAGTYHHEVRNTADPHYITGLLMAILSGLTASSPTKIKGIVKHMRNDILWHQAYKPWRRSSLWLAIRVSVHLALHHLGHPPDLYKSFMAFFMADLLSLKDVDKMPSATVFCALSKLGNRMRKLAEKCTVHPTLTEKVLAVTEKVFVKLNERWEKIQQQQLPTVDWVPSQLNFEADTQISLSNSQTYLDKCLGRIEPPSPLPSYTPPTHRRLFLSANRYSEFNSHVLTQAIKEDRPTALVETEAFVLEHLADLDLVRQPLDAARLCGCIAIYTASAQEEYKGNPETLSTMILTVFILWMIIDKIAILKLPLLKEYSPEVPTSLLNPILLSTSRQMQRYIMVQHYICDRHRTANRLFPSIFDSQAVYNSFSVRHFEGSNALQELKAKIEAFATKERREKFEELARKQKERRSLLNQSNHLEHAYDIYGHHRTKKCTKCRLGNRANNLSIDVHEWPLPAQRFYAEWTVFECNVPAEFRAWRGMTYDILHDLCRPGLASPQNRPAVQCVLPNYNGLTQYVGSVYKVTLASDTKSFSNSHYRSLRVSDATEAQVSVKNGLNFKLYDSQRDLWIKASSFDDCALDGLCTWKIPVMGTYNKLSYALSTTTHSPNAFIADQSETPTTLDLHEHMSFGNLRCGSNLQWLNILRELRTRVLSFSRQEVQSLVLQAALQAGPATDSEGQALHHRVGLDWHDVLTEPRFFNLLLKEIDRLLESIEKNWAQDTTLETLILLTLRLLASHHSGLLPHILKTLSLARKISYEWMKTFVAQLSTPADSPMTGAASVVPSRIFVSAALCRLTFNVDTHHLRKVFKNDRDVAIFLECSIRLHDNTPSTNNLPPRFIRLLARNLRLNQALHDANYFSIFVSNHQQGLHLALQAVWNAYTPSDWQLLHPDDGQSWITLSPCHTTSEQNAVVHLNMKDGTLLVNGKPLGRLPESITDHSTYKRLLGNQVLDVVPSPLAGSDFATRNHVDKSEFQLHFRLSGTSLVIRSTRGSQCFELIPHGILAADFPIFFTQNFTHWLFIGHDGIPRIEFRPLQDHWKPSDNNWHLILKSRLSATFQCGTDPRETRTRLVDIHSRSCQMVSSLLRSLDAIKFMQVTWSPDSPLEIVATLPRYKLSFTLRNGELHSDNFPDVIVDRTQCCGTLYGLRNILSLRSIAAARNYVPRQCSIIIPYGQITVRQKKDHVIVDIQKSEQAPFIRYFKYDLDTNLRSLVGTSLLSELYRIYLHAITSHLLPDPFLQCSGTEEAVGFLRSSRCRSFQSLSDDEEGLLLKIAKLAPKREWYPKSHQVMQSVEWFDIPPLSQHWSYPVLVDEILEYAKSLLLISNQHKNDTQRNLVSNHGHLAKRSLSLNLHLLSPWDYRQNVKHFSDSIYSHTNIPIPHRLLQADKSPLKSRIKNAGSTSALVQQWPKQIKTNCNPWKLLSAASQPLHKHSPDFSLTYDSDFLNVDFSKFWFPYYEACISALDKNVCKAQLMFTLPAIAYQLDNTEVVSSLLAFATYPEFHSIHPPLHLTYNLSDGCSPIRSELETLIQSHIRLLESGECSYCPPGTRNQRWDESEHEFNVRRRHVHDTTCKKDVEFLASFLVEQWNINPSSQLILPSNHNEYGHVHLSSAATAQLRGRLTSWFSNFELRTKFLQPIHAILLRNCQPSIAGPSRKTHFYVQTPAAAAFSPVRQCSSVSLLDRLCERALDICHLSIPWIFPPTHAFFPTLTKPSDIPKPATVSSLFGLLAEFINHKDPLHVEYGRSLEQSCEGHNRKPVNVLPDLSSYVDHQFQQFYLSCQTHYQGLLVGILTSLLPQPSDVAGRIQAASFHWPKVNIRSLFALRHEIAALTPQLAVGSEAIIRALAQGLIHLQRSQRVVKFWLSNHFDEVAKELANEPDLHLQPIDWLFIQIEGNFLARSLQMDVAKKMITPDGGSSVIQLNMGEGKTSVIVPLVASTLADGEKLARVIVLKPLARAMFSLLVQRLSGLVDRRIFYLPFARTVNITPMQTQKLQQLFDLCLKERGILIAQPEHILSFKLIGIDLINKLHAHNGSKSTVQNLLENQRWLTERCRDTLDESDEILSVKYRLIYTSGRQAPVENSPYRWLQIQAIFSLVLDHVRESQSVDSKLGWSGIECESVPLAEFPIIRVLDAHICARLSGHVATALLSDTKFRFLPHSLRDIAKQFISSRSAEENKIGLLHSALTPELWSSLLLYRGFCAFGILDHLFREKRWRVNYGLYPARTLLAVPYRAKDVPALRADFGHPDVALSLTCLSYYYGGLTRDQFDDTVRLLLKIDNPLQEYSLWTAKVMNLSPSLQDVVGINLDDSALCDGLYDVFRRNHAAINFYLSNVVFPKEAKQFPRKLATSAWDLAEERTHPITGFSGTNDNKDLLPLSMVQRDPVEQLGTNARVLDCLLQHENDHYLLLASHEDKQILLSEDYLMSLIAQVPEIRVLLDVGAQMLDKKNDEIASRWLDLQAKAEAVIFFDDDDCLVIMTQDRSIEPLEASAYSQKLDCCLVYLDDAHTRGTDLKLPSNYRAAVTLCAGLNKDRLAQGCMRMRKLGAGQSVIFFAPQEVDTSIRKLAKKQNGERIGTIDVLRWAMTETCNSIRRNIPHWAQQGFDYNKRNNAWVQFWKEFAGPMTENNPPTSTLLTLRKNWEDDDARGLEAMYGPSSDRECNHPAFSVPSLQLHLTSLGVHSLNDVGMDEEQEREVHHEAEQEREVERPRPAKPAKDNVHLDVRYLIQHGVRKHSPAFVPMFSSFSYLNGYSPSWSQNLWSTKAFATTIVTNTSTDGAEYQRPVHWLLTSKKDFSIVALSPYEVNELLPDIKKSTHVHLHMYAPRVNQTMDSFEDLTFFVIPPLSSDWTSPSQVEIAQINLWAGQLYLKDRESYEILRMVLGIVGEQLGSEDVQCEPDGFVPPQHRSGRMKEVCAFTISPLRFLRELVSLRQKGKSYSSTHMGKILDGRLLTDRDF